MDGTLLLKIEWLGKHQISPCPNSVHLEGPNAMPEQMYSAKLLALRFILVERR